LKQVFSDVTPDKWYYNEIQRGAFYGLLEGLPDGTYRPDLTMSRADAGVAIVRSFDRLIYYSLLINGIVLSAVLFARKA